MKYTSRITSKGTITLPAKFRKQLGLQAGDVVELSLKNLVVSVRPKMGWAEFFAATEKLGEKARQDIASGKKKSLLTSKEITKAAMKERLKRYAKS